MSFVEKAAAILHVDLDFDYVKNELIVRGYPDNRASKLQYLITDIEKKYNKMQFISHNLVPKLDELEKFAKNNLEGYESEEINAYILIREKLMEIYKFLMDYMKPDEQFVSGLKIYLVILTSFSLRLERPVDHSILKNFLVRLRNELNFLKSLIHLFMALVDTNMSESVYYIQKSQEMFEEFTANSTYVDDNMEATISSKSDRVLTRIKKLFRIKKDEQINTLIMTLHRLSRATFFRFQIAFCRQIELSKRLSRSYWQPKKFESQEYNIYKSYFTSCREIHCAFLIYYPENIANYSGTLDLSNRSPSTTTVVYFKEEVIDKITRDVIGDNLRHFGSYFFRTINNVPCSRESFRRKSIKIYIARMDEDLFVIVLVNNYVTNSKDKEIQAAIKDMFLIYNIFPVLKYVQRC